MNRSIFGFPLFVATTMIACGDQSLVEDVLPADASVPTGDLAPAPIRVDPATVGNAPAGATSILPAFDGGPTQPLTVLDLGTVKEFAPVSFTVPPNTLGFHVSVESDSHSEALAIMSVRSPNGRFVHSAGTPFGGSNTTSGTIFGRSAAVQIPQSQHPDVMPKVVPGIWQVSFRGAGTLRAKVQIQSTPDGEFHGGTLGLDVYLPIGLRLGGPIAITPENAATTPAVVERMNAFFANMFELYGLRNGRIRFHEIPARFVTVEDSELDTIFQETRVAEGAQSLHVFLSEKSQSTSWLGVSPGTPGVANAPGNDASGVVLASIPDGNADLDGVILAHEAGHFFGLEHTTGHLDGEPDALTDTPVCPDMAANFRSCPDASNVMFPYVGVRAVSSPAQRRVAQGSPIFEAFLATPRNAIDGIRRVPPSPTADLGTLFGHTGRPLQPAERIALVGACGHPSHGRATLSQATQSALESISTDPRVVPTMRNAAGRVLVR